jgi:hypothetical protein
LHDPEPRDQYQRAFACFCPRPATHQKLDFLFAADQRCARKGERNVTRLGDAAPDWPKRTKRRQQMADLGERLLVQNLGSISKQGDRYLGGLFTFGALVVIRYAK